MISTRCLLKKKKNHCIINYAALPNYLLPLENVKLKNMFIERTSNEVIIHLPSTIDMEDLQEFLDYARYKEITSKFSISQKKVDKLAKDINKNWRNKNRTAISK